MTRKKFNVAIAGATGAVGNVMIKCLEERNFPVANLKLLASKRSAGKKLGFKGNEVVVEEMTKDSFKDVDIALFSAGGGISLEFAPIAAQAGAVVVDNSSAWRMDPEVPLVVPEANPQAVAGYKAKGIIANPNCSTIQMVVALAPIYKEFGIKRIVVSTYQAVSGSGKKAIDELLDETRAKLDSLDYKRKVYPHDIAFNCIPHIDDFLESGYTKEEMKMVNETRKIFGDNKIGVTATTVRVPVFYGHSESVNLETITHADISKVKKLLESSKGIKVLDNPKENVYPLALDAAGKDFVFVGRLRQDESIENGLNMWIVADNIRKGAATNTVQIAELLAESYL
ncbi:MAG: aspartate-semialdehyde dehydrogenase [Desulforegulaceae bacterium]|nr:aspartate-semialdehyde dehydrogenase [Desulforegulaceae bacterium]